MTTNSKENLPRPRNLPAPRRAVPRHRIHIRHALWHAPVSRENCIPGEATEFALTGNVPSEKHSAHLYRLRNGQRYEIDGACIGQLVLDGVENLQPQEPITLLLHPNSDTILEFSSTSGTLMAFDDATQRVANDTLLFTALGILMYAAALADYITSSGSGSANAAEKNKIKRHSILPHPALAISPALW